MPQPELPQPWKPSRLQIAIMKDAAGLSLAGVAASVGVTVSQLSEWKAHLAASSKARRLRGYKARARRQPHA